MAETEWRGKVALVTGAGVRVGKAIALAFARAGADLAVHCLSSRAAAEQTAAEARALGVRAAVLQADQAKPGEAERLVEGALGALGRLDALVCSAARFERAPLAELTWERWQAMLDANLTGPAFLARAAYAELKARRGAIVNLVDLCGTAQVWKGYAHYTAAKAGLAALTRQLALEWAPEVRVNAIAPGTVLFPDDTTDDERARIERRIPLGHAGAPEDVARAAVFLASQPFVTGQILAIDGGRSVNP